MKKRLVVGFICMMVLSATCITMADTAPTSTNLSESIPPGMPDPAAANLHIGNLPGIPEAKGPLSEEEAVELAKLYVLGTCIYDDGISRFSKTISSYSSTMQWEAFDIPVIVVELSAISHNHRYFPLTVYIHKALGRVLRIAGQDTMWQDDRFFAGLSLAPSEPAGHDAAQPEWNARYDEYRFKQTIQYNRYGDPRGWTLEQSAEGSALALAYGFTWQEDKIHILPGHDDLPEEEALETAKTYVWEVYGLHMDDVAEIWSSFFYPPGSPEDIMWEFRFHTKAPGHDYAIRLDTKGSLKDSWKSEWENAVPEDTSAVMDRDVMNELYLLNAKHAVPEDDELGEAEAVRLAEEIFHLHYPPSIHRKYNIQSGFWQSALSGERWWMVEFYDIEHELIGLPYLVLLVAPDGSRHYRSEDYGPYADAVVWDDGCR